jgi:hypothetical protein
LGYYLVVDDHKKRVLALAPTDLIKRRFDMRFKEHFDSIEQEMGSEQLVVKRILEYIQSLFVGLAYYFELASNKIIVHHNLYSQMANTAFSFIKRRFGLSREEVVRWYGPTFDNLRSEETLANGRHKLLKRIRRTCLQ